MRLDLTLYGLAVVLLVIAAVVFVVVSGPDGQIVYGVATIILALLVAVTGYKLRPKTAATVPSQPVSPPPEAMATEPVQPAAPAEAPVAPAVKVEAPTVETPPPPPAAEAPAPVEAPKPPEPAAPTPVLTAPQPAPQLSPPEEVPALAPSAPAAESELTQIRGINAKWAEQLKANGINTIEDLGKANPEELAAKLAASPRIVKMWVGSAKKRTR